MLSGQYAMKINKQDLGLQCQTPLRFQYENFFCLKKILNSKNFGSEKIQVQQFFWVKNNFWVKMIFRSK